MTSPTFACAFCKHFIRKMRSENVCSAFPLGIPNVIARRDNHHLELYVGDSGTQFEPLPGFEDVFAPSSPKVFKRQIPWDRPKR